MKKIIKIIAVLYTFAATTTAGAQSWNLTGNAGTDPATDFIGTTDAIAFKIRTNSAIRVNVTSGGKIALGNFSPLFKLDVKGSINTDSVYRIGGNIVLSVKGTDNTFVGTQSGFSNGTGRWNTANGYQALYSNTSGFTNTANGSSALYFNTTGNSNTASGYQTLYYNITGIYNTANGRHALYANTTGGSNTANGSNALYSNTTGNNNTANGRYALWSNVAGNNATAIGYYAMLYANNQSGAFTNYNVALGFEALRGSVTASANTGNYNTSLGYQTLRNNTTGSHNTTDGYRALYSNSTGNDNTANGSDALSSNTTGDNNTANGSGALSGNTDGTNNTAIGAFSLYSNEGHYNIAIGTYSLYSNTIGGNNTAAGHNSLYSNTTGIHNVALGFNSLYLNTTGTGNIAAGTHALYENTGGLDNVAIGYGSGATNDSNFYCTFLGPYADESGTTNLLNSTALGNASRITADNQVRIGNAVITSIGGYEPWSNLSDGRYKKNVKENVPGIEFINQLRPVTYTMDVSGLRKFLREDITGQEGTEGFQEMNAETKRLIEQGIKKKEKIIYSGFIAQEVEMSAQKLGYNFSGVDKPQNESSLYGLRYSEFVVPLVKAVQELSKQNDELKERVAKLEALINVQQSATNPKLQTTNLSSASLEQNTPNPFNQTTTIRYTLPAQFVSAQMVITDESGKVLRQVNISATGNGMLNIQAGALSTGTYNYSLFIDGRLIDTKKMILTR